MEFGLKNSQPATRIVSGHAENFWLNQPKSAVWVELDHCSTLIKMVYLLCLDSDTCECVLQGNISDSDIGNAGFGIVIS